MGRRDAFCSARNNPIRGMRPGFVHLRKVFFQGHSQHIGFAQIASVDPPQAPASLTISRIVASFSNKA